MSRSFVVFLTLLVFSSMAFSIDVSTCTLINSPGTYDLTTSVSGQPYSFYLGAYDTCVLVDSTSNVILDCHGYTITGTAEAAVAIQNSSNVEVRNCNLGATWGVSYYNANNTDINNNNMTANWGITGLGNNYYNLIEYNDIVAGTYGIFWAVENSTIRYNDITGGSVGLLSSGDNSVTDNYVYNSQRCVDSYGNDDIRRNVAYNCSSSCYSMPYYSSGSTFINNTADTCGNGFYTQGGSGAVFQSNIIRNVNNGVYLRTWFSEGVDYASFNLIDLNQISNCNVGIEGYYDIYNNFTRNTIDGCTGNGVEMNNSGFFLYNGNDVLDSGINGFRLNGAANGTVSGNYVDGSTGVGYSLNGATNNDLTGNSALGNTGYGYFLSGSTYNRLNGNAANSNLDNGFMISSSNYNNLTDNSANSNTNVGIRLTSSDYCVLDSNVVTDSTHGIWVTTGSDYNSLLDNDVSSCSNSGVYVLTSQFTTLTGNELYENQKGIEVYWGSNYTQLYNNEIYDNTNIGVHLRDSLNIALHNDHLYGNSNDLDTNGTSLGLSLTMDGVVFDSDGTYTNYTNISMSDSTTSGYFMRWNSQPTVLPFPMVSFNQKFIDIEDVGAADSIDDITWHWNNAELGGFDESMLQLWDYSGTWSLLNDTPDTANNELSLEDLSSFSTFAILAGGACPAPITSPGVYTLTGDLEGSTNNASPIVGTACIKIASSDVVLDCDGYSITNNGTAGITHAVVSNGTFTNVTVMNCPNMSDYTRGVFYYQTSNGAIRNSSAYNNAHHGFLLNSFSNNNVVENCHSEGNAYYGFYLSNSDNNNLTDNTAVGNVQMGYYVQNSDYNRFVGDVADNNTVDGFRTTTSTGNVFVGCSASGQDYGFNLEGGSSHNLTSCTALYNDIGFYANGSNSNFFIDVNGSFGDDGLRLESSTGNLVDPSYFCDNDRQGVYLLNSNSNTVSDSTMCRNGDNGVYLEGSNSNDIYRNDAYDNVGNGFQAAVDSDNNDFVNNTAYGTTGGNGFAITQSASSGNNLVGNTAYENDLCGFIAFQSPGNSFTGNTAYDNGERGFRIFQANDNVLMDNTAYGHTDASLGNGLSIYQSNNTVATNDHYYGNTAPDVLIDGSGIIATLNGVIIDSDAGTYTNYSNVSVDDLVSSAYSLEWTAEPVPVPVNYRSFNGKFLNITNLTAGVSIDRLAMHWLESELAPDYTEGDLRLIYLDGVTWGFLNTTPDEVNNELSYEAITESTTLAIVEFTGIEDTDGNPTEDELSISFSSGCEGNVVTVTSGGNEIKSASVQVIHKDALYDVAVGSTNDDGEFTFMGCGIPVKVLVSKTGFQSASVARTLVACGECELECGEDADCSDAEHCLNNMCQRVDCSCGVIESHKCSPYECCQDSDCDSLQACIQNVCVDNYDCSSDEDCESSEYCKIAEGAVAGFCEDVTGLCGEADDHEWVQFDCGDEEGCPDCPESFTCVNHECEENEVQGEDGFVGDRKIVKVLRGGEPCALCDIQITGPDGRSYTGKTDGNGEFELPLNLEGTYKVVLVDENGDGVAEGAMNALPKPAPQEPEKPTEAGGLDASALFLVVLLVLLIIGLVYWRRGKTK